MRIKQEGIALSELHKAEVAGAPSPVIADTIVHTLASDRLVEVDDFGSLRLTERGRHHLQYLERNGTLKRAAAKSRWRR